MICAGCKHDVHYHETIVYGQRGKKGKCHCTCLVVSPKGDLSKCKCEALIISDWKPKIIEREINGFSLKIYTSSGKIDVWSKGVYIGFTYHPGYKLPIGVKERRGKP